MGLLDLPLEIIDEVINLTLPAGIEAFASRAKLYMRARRRKSYDTTLSRNSGGIRQLAIDAVMILFACFTGSLASPLSDNTLSR